MKPAQTHLKISTIVNRSLLYWLILPCLLIVVLVGFSSAFWMHAQMVSSTNLAVQTLGRHVQAYTEDSAMSLAAFAGKTRGLQSPHLEHHMAEFISASPQFLRLLLLAPSGRILHSVPSGAEGRDFPLEINEVSDGSLMLSRPVPSPVSGELVIYLGLSSGSGRVFIGELSLVQLQKHLQSLRPFGEGSIILADAFGNLISHPDQSSVRRQDNIGGLDVVRSSSGTPHTTFIIDPAGSYFGTTQRLPHTNWVLLAKTPARSLLQPILRSTLILLVTIAGLLLIVALRTRQVLAARVVKPLEQFTQSIGEVASGNYDAAHAPPPSASFELAQAGKEFMAMAATVHHREEQIRESEGRFRQLVENMHEVFWIREKDSAKTMYVSPAFEHVFGLKRESIMQDAYTFLARVHPDDRAEVESLFDRLHNSGRAFSHEYRLLMDDGRITWIKTRAFPVFGEGGSIVRTLGIAEDVTDARRHQRALQSIVQGTSATTGSSFFLSLTQSLAEVLNVQHSIASEYLDSPPTRARSLAFWQAGKHVTPTEYDVTATPSKNLWREGYCYLAGDVLQRFPDDSFLCESNATTYMGVPLMDSQGEAIGHLAVFSCKPIEDEDNARSIMTVFSARAGAELERLRAERAIAASLLEKEILLKEIHHRVKNNLQIISSLLFLQMEYVRLPEDRELFSESQKRIQAMALVHEELYGSDDLSSVEMNEYVPRLVERVLAGANIPVRVECQVDHIQLPVTRSIPCGLILNELVMNAVKHAFRPDGQSQPMGILRVGLRREDRSLVLVVEDNGPGLPQNFDISDTPTLGMTLISSLTEQLGGRISTHNASPGARFRLEIPQEDA